LALKKIFQSTLIIACCTVGVVGAVKKYKHVFLTRPTFSQEKTVEFTGAKSDVNTAQVIDYEAPSIEIGATALPKIDRMNQLFTTGSAKFPIVETVSFSSKVNWLEGRLAWIADYASHFKTSRHFIARSLNGKPDYFSQQVSSGNKFNVYKIERPFDFHMVVDLSTCQMALYYHDHLTNERVLIKTYTAGIGRKDDSKASGCLTPIGTYKIGQKIAIYKPGIMGTFQDKKIEMIRIFGTRWLPFEACDPHTPNLSKGLGIHGLPWSDTEDGENLTENLTSIGCYSSDGCIRLSKDDVEELFAVVITKPCFVHIVDSMQNATLPGTEVAQPTR
jgi:hypothetical protein